jgi:hypothetical protein
VKPVGRIPTWCSQTCRQRAWEQKRAAESGLAAVRVAERVVEQPTRGGFDAAALRPGDWPALLQVLAQQLERGRIYKRDLPDLTRALDDLISAYRRATR